MTCLTLTTCMCVCDRIRGVRVSERARSICIYFHIRRSNALIREAPIARTVFFSLTLSLFLFLRSTPSNSQTFVALDNSVRSYSHRNPILSADTLLFLLILKWSSFACWLNEALFLVSVDRPDSKEKVAYIYFDRESFNRNHCPKMTVSLFHHPSYDGDNL